MKDRLEEYSRPGMDSGEVLRHLEEELGEDYRRDGLVIRESDQSYFDLGQVVAGLASKDDEGFGERFLYDPYCVNEETIDQAVRNNQEQVAEVT